MVNNVAFHQSLCGEPTEPLTIFKDAYPVTVYFATRADADEFIAAAREANLNLEHL